MNTFTRNQIKSYILEYLKKKNPEFKIQGKLFQCPFHQNHQEQKAEPSCNIFPQNSGKAHCFDPNCGKLGDIFDICRKLDFDNNPDVGEEDIADYLIQELKIQVNNDVEKLLSKYVTWEWSLIPIVKDSKVPAQKEWTTKVQKDQREWQQWLNNGSGLGLVTGKISNVIGIDVDLINKQEAEIWQKGTATKSIEDIIIKKETNLKKLKELNLLNDTVTQDSGWKGVHYFYIYDEAIPKTSFDYEGLHFDIESDGGYCLIEPSTFAGKGRVISGEIINPMTSELKKFLLANIKKEKSLEIKTEISTVEDGEKIKGLEGCCNQTFVKIMGQFRKFMPLDNVERSAHIINQQMLDDPMDNKTIKSMCQQIEKYHKADVDTIGEKILDHLKIVKIAHIKDLKECLGFDRKDLEQSLRILTDHKKVYKIKKDLYELIADVEWQEDFLSFGKPLPFKVPYFEEYAHFDQGSMIIIGGPTGVGKTTLSMNFVKRFVKQGINPHLISTEAGSKFQKVAQSLSLKEGDFKYFITNDPTTVPLPTRAVTIIDWLKPIDSDYAKTDLMYEKLNNKLVEKGGLLIVLAQLRSENKKFYSEDMTMFYGALVAKMLYPCKDGMVDNLSPYFSTQKIRDSKVGKQYIDIPMTYDYNTRELELKK